MNILTQIYYFLGFIILLYYLISIDRYDKVLKIKILVDELFKTKKWNQLTYSQKSILLSYRVIPLFIGCWIIIGLFTVNWIIVLFSIIVSSTTFNPLMKEFLNTPQEKIISKLSLFFICIIVSLMMANHYYLHINIFELLSNYF